jgi:hypothetical protein
VCHFGFALSFFSHFFVMCLSFYCHFGNGKMGKTLKHDYHDKPFVISWQHQIHGTTAETLGKPAGREEE